MEDFTGLVLVAGCGRSGTMSCAQAINALHEPRGGNDFDPLNRMDEEEMEWYARDKIGAWIRSRLPNYREVNSVLAFYMKWLAPLFPQAKIYHLTRNEDDVVASILRREHYTPEAQPRQRLEPKGGFPDGTTREEKVRWYVRFHKRFMDGYPIIKIEDLTDIRLNASHD